MKTRLTPALVLLLSLTAVPLLASAEDTPAPPPPAASPTPLPSETPAPRAPSEADEQSQLFSVALVLADNSPAAAAKLPPALDKAIGDVRDFLPFKSFRLLDSGLIRTRRDGSLFLRGDNGREFRVQMVLYPSDNHGVPSFVFETFRLETRPATGAVMEKPVTVLTASFRVDRGETVVVGSAKLESVDGAIIVLLTAVP
ncbi:MAG: hypothetical protein SF066_08960 [Thermoanaerobaculia bacterium]|nr:hypothetical protein [Thermoanaerobaculia bacterium]